MEEIRACREEDLGDVADLYLRVIRGQSRTAPSSLTDAFRDSFLTNPWVEPDISPQVLLDGGKLAGFLGVIPRPMEFRGRPIRAATITIWMVDHKLHRGLGGMKLLSHLLQGPQEFSMTDGAGNEASEIYKAVGGRVSPLYSFTWIRILRPCQTARSLLDRAGGVLSMLKGASGVFTGPLDFLLSKAPVEMLQRPKSSCPSKSVTATELLECIQEARGREALRPVYSMPSFNWLIAQAGHRGLRLKIVYSPDGERCGWFVYYAPPGGIAFVFQIGCNRRNRFKDVLRALFEDAWEQGSCAVRGRAMPQYLVPLSEQYCVFRQPFASVIGYSRDPEIMNAFLTADFALSGLDSGGFLRFSALDWI